MFDIQKIGKKLYELRKKKGLTQIFVAEKLNISFQAVSSWERGQCMPDIAKLVELAKIYGVNTDELISCEEKTYKNQTEMTDTESYTDNNFVHLQAYFNNLNNYKSKNDLENFFSLAPFMNKEEVDKKFSEAINIIEDFEELAAAIPFVTQKTIDDNVIKIYNRKKEIDLIVAALPFISQNVIQYLFEHESNNDDIAPLIPFIKL